MTRCGRKVDGKCIDHRYGILIGEKGERISELQELWFRVDDGWTEDAARNYCDEQEGDFGAALPEPEEEESMELNREVVPYKSYPLGRVDGAWDGDDAEMQLREWSSSDGSGDPDMIDWPMYREGFLWYDADNQDLFGSYKGPHHEVEDGELVTPIPGIQAAMNAVLGGRGGFDVSESDRRAMYDHLVGHYEEFDLEPPEYTEAVKEDGETFVDVTEEAEEDGTISQKVKIGASGDLDNFPEEVRGAFAERIGIDADGVFVFQTVPSTQALDSYGTRMSAGVLNRYLQDALDGVPVMNSHRTGGFLEQTELPLGRSFHAELFGEPVDESPLIRGEGDIREADLSQTGLMLRAWDYMLRDHHPNGPSNVGTDDVIRSIEGRVLKDISIGFNNAIPETVRLTCGLCGQNISEWEWFMGENSCPHLPLLRDEKTGLLGFAWISGARMLEHSTVWKGATPGAIIEKARGMAKAGLIRSEQVGFLENAYGVRLMPRKVVMVKPERKTAGTIIGGQQAEAVPPIEQEEEVMRVELDATGFDEAADRILAALDAFNKRLTHVEQRVDAPPEHEPEQQEDDCSPCAQRDELFKRAVAAKTRAGLRFDEAAYRKRLEKLSDDEVEAEIAEYGQLTTQAFKPGRVVGRGGGGVAPERTKEDERDLARYKGC